MTSYEIALVRRAWAHRLVLAYTAKSYDAIEVVSDEIGDCPGCWRAIGEHLGALLADLTVRRHGRDGAITRVEHVVASLLDDLDGYDQ